MLVKARISQSTVDKIQAHFRKVLPDVDPKLLIQAIAQGLGWPHYNLLRNKLKELRTSGKPGRIECKFNDNAFEECMRSIGHTVEPSTFSNIFLASPVANTTFSVVVWSDTQWRVRAPYPMLSPLYSGEPSKAASPETLRILNGGRSHKDFLNGLRSGYAEYAAEAFKKPIPPGACPEFIEARKDLQSFTEYMKEVFEQNAKSAEDFHKRHFPKRDLEGEAFVQRVISEAKAQRPTT